MIGYSGPVRSRYVNPSSRAGNSNVKTLQILLTSLLLAAATPAGTAATASTEGRQTSLKQAFADAFLVGTALSRAQILGEEPATLELVKQQFNSLTAENEMKWERIEPLEGQFDWEAPDALVAFAEANGMALAGHVLVWHSQIPDWVFQDATGEPASREVLLARMENHINAVVGRYRGKVKYWEVVNEALNDDGTLRQTPWLTIIGEDYIEKAFEFAHRADPGARLYYNDYNMYQPAKRAGAVRLVQALLDKGIPVSAIGMQGHYGLGHPEDWADFEGSIKAFAELGVSVHVTELDISVLPFPDEQSRGADLSVNLELNARLNPYADGLPADVEQQQIDRYLNLFRILLAHRDSVERVTFWGVHDAQNWKNDWPMRGRTDYPLLFDRQGQPKPVYYDIIALTR
jgi:endo-1,4-beta-xylanase